MLCRSLHVGWFVSARLDEVDRERDGYLVYVGQLMPYQTILYQNSADHDTVRCQLKASSLLLNMDM